MRTPQIEVFHQQDVQSSSLDVGFTTQSLSSEQASPSARERRLVPSLREAVTRETSRVARGGWITGREGGRSWTQSRTKRAIELSVILLAGVPAGLILVPTIAVLIKLDSRGPVFFMQPRSGKMGRRFFMAKFRTMVRDAEALKPALRGMDHHGSDSPDFKIRNDPRVTRVGRILRRFSLDEIPNMYNVVTGEMSLIGPRPTSFPIDTYQEWQLARLAAVPGVTGLWQISGRSDLDFDKRVELDLDYLRNQSPWLDFKIAIATIVRIFDGRGAY